MPSSIQGQNGSKALFKVAMVLVERFACSPAEAMPYMHWFNRASCRPAWSEKEIQRKVNDAVKRINPANLGSLNTRSFNNER